jgi:UDP-glucose 4-epimerase
MADLRSAEARHALSNVEVLWHLGFSLWRRNGHQAPEPPGDDVNLAATANVCAAGPERIVYASSAAVYGAWPDNRLPLRENDEARPNRECAYAAQKLTGEGVCRAAAPTSVLRIGAVLGPHADAGVARAALGYRTAVPAIRGVVSALQFVDEADVATALLAAGRLASTGVYNVATNDWLSAADVARIAGGRVIRLPRWMLVGASEAMFRLRLLPFGADRAVLVNGPLALDCTRAAHELDWRPTRRSAEVLATAVSR